MLLALIFSCSSSPAPAPAPEAHEAAEAHEAHEAHEAAEAGSPKVNLGKAPDQAAAVAIDAILAQAASYEGKAVTVRAPVAAVCQKKGCWHKLGTADPNVTVMCKDKEYEVFLPMDAGGKTAVVSGIFHTETVSVEEARHYAEDEGKDPASVTAPLTQYSIDVDGVALL